MDEDFDDLKMKAAEYYANNKVPEKLEEILNQMFFESPDDVNGRIAEYFETFALPPTICNLKCKRILSASGDIALKCSVFAIIKNHKQVLESSQVSIRAESNHFNNEVLIETEQVPSPEEIFEKNRKNINEILSKKLNGKILVDQVEVDRILSDWANDVEKPEASKVLPNDLDDLTSITPTPSSGRKKKPASVKQKASKISDKSVPPKEPSEYRAPGFTSTFAVSTAILKSSSNYLKIPPYQHLIDSMQKEECSVDEKKTITMPAVAMTILTGGKFAPGKLNLFENIFVIGSPSSCIRDSVTKLSTVYLHAGKPATAKPGSILNTGPYGAYHPTYDKMEQPLDAILEAINASGLVPGQDLFIGIECCSKDTFDYDKGKYEVISGNMKTADDLLEIYKDLVARYPALIMLVDPFRKEDREQWSKLCESISEKCFVVGGEAVYGSLHKVNCSSLTDRPTSGVAVSNSGRITCSDMFRVINDVRSVSGVTIFTSTTDDANDDVYSDLAVGLEVDVVRMGAPSRGEYTSRLNRMIEIEEMIKESDKWRINYRDSFSFPIIKPPSSPVADVADTEKNEQTVSPTPDGKGKKK